MLKYLNKEESLLKVDVIALEIYGCNLFFIVFNARFTNTLKISLREPFI